MNSLLFDFTTAQIFLAVTLFVWSGFVRSGLGFGGAALGLPLMLFIYDQPLFWLPVIGLHLLFFSALTLRTRLNNVDWRYLRHACMFIIPTALVGVFGLITFPNQWLLIFIYSVSLVCCNRLYSHISKSEKGQIRDGLRREWLALYKKPNKVDGPYPTCPEGAPHFHQYCVAFLEKDPPFSSECALSWRKWGALI